MGWRLTPRGEWIVVGVLLVLGLGVLGFVGWVESGLG
jgi:hypothetical protein